MIKDSETGDELGRSNIYLPDNVEPQKMGSAITYYRRYSLQSMLLLEAEDDDGNSTKYIPQQKTNANIDETMKCNCGGDIERHEGISAKTNNPYIKLTCLSCGKVNWG